MAIPIDKQDRDIAKQEKLFMFQIAVDGRYAETDRGSSSIVGACTAEQAKMLRSLIRTWDTGNTFKTDLHGPMPLCIECQTTFTINLYPAVCDSCGCQIERRYTELQEFKAGHLNMMELSSRVVWGESGDSQTIWRIG